MRHFILLSDGAYMNKQESVKQISRKKLVSAIRSVMFGLCISSTAFVHAEQHATQPYDVAAGSLGSALSSFAVQSGVALTFDPALTRGLKTKGLKGQYSLEQGFAELLKNTNYEIRQTNNSYYLEQKIQNNKNAEVVKLSTLQSKASHENYLNSDTSSDSVLPVITLKAENQESPLKRKSAITVLGNQSVLDTPFSVTVVNHEDIEKRGAKSVGQIFANDASVYSPASVMTTNWWATQIRGLGVKNYYINDVPMTLNWGGDFPVEFADNVVALKGLTGFMYGFGSPGGAISYQLKQATKEPQTSLDLGYRTDRIFSAMVDTSSHFAPANINYRFILGGETGTAYNDSKTDRFFTGLMLDKQLLDNLTWDANVIYEKNDLEKEPMQFALWSYDPTNSGTSLPKVTYKYQNLNVDNSYYKTETLMASSGLKWQINDDWYAKYQFGYTRKRHDSNKSFADIKNSAGDYDGIIYQFSSLDENYFNQLMFNGLVNFGQIRNNLVFGIGQSENASRFANNSVWDTFFTGNLYQPTNYSIDLNPDFSLGDKSTTTQNFAFLSDTIDFTDQFKTILGVRYTDYKDDSSDPDYKTNVTTPTFALIYKPNADSALYASYVEALEAGQLVSGEYTNAGEILDATISKQYEFGFKYDLDKLSLSTGLFRIERTSLITEGTGNQKALVQDGMTIYEGAELNTNYKVSDQWKLGVSLIHLDAKLDGLSTSNQNLKGNTPSATPEWQVVLNTDYLIPVVEGLSLHANVRYNGTSYLVDENTLKTPAYTVANAGLSYKFRLAQHDAMLNANVNNLFNKKYWTVNNGGYFSAGEAVNGSVGLKVNW